MLHAVTAEEAGKRTDVVVARLSGASRTLVAASDPHAATSASTALRQRRAARWPKVTLLEFEIRTDSPTLIVASRSDRRSRSSTKTTICNRGRQTRRHGDASGATARSSGTLVNALLAHAGAASGRRAAAGAGAPSRPRHVRLAGRRKNTSAALAALGAAMKARRIKREYLGLVRGVPEHPRGTIEGADRPRPAQPPQVRDYRRGQAGDHALRSARSVRAARRTDFPPRNRPDASDSRAPGGDGTPDPQRSRIREAAKRGSISRVRPCTRGALPSRIRVPARAGIRSRRRPTHTCAPAPCCAPMDSGPKTAAFTVRAFDRDARRASLALAHGPVETPCFMPVGTAATVKGLTPARAARRAARKSCLANTYHLWLRPGARRHRGRRRPAPLHGLGRADSHRLRRLSSLQPGRPAPARRRRRNLSLAPRRQRTSLYARERDRVRRSARRRRRDGARRMREVARAARTRSKPRFG